MSEKKDPIFIILSALAKAVAENPKAVKFSKEFGKRVGFRVPGECVILFDTANLRVNKYVEKEAPETDLELIGRRKVLTDIIVLEKSPMKYMVMRKFRTKGGLNELMKYGKIADFVRGSPITDAAAKKARNLVDG